MLSPTLSRYFSVNLSKDLIVYLFDDFTSIGYIFNLSLLLLEMIKSIPYCQNNFEYFVDRLLNKIDPFNNKRFIFNDCVNAFSTEIIEDYPMSQSNYSRGFSEMENLNIGLNIQNETTLLDKICLGI